MYEFSLGASLLGLVIMIAGALMIVFYQKIGNYISYGTSSYDKVKLWGLIACAIGFVLLANLHNLLLRLLLNFLGIR